MSDLATDWAIQQRGLHPAAKLVLWHLCDRHTPGSGCFPSQEQLTADAEISRASLNIQLRRLEDAGLIPGNGGQDAAQHRGNRPAIFSVSRPTFPKNHLRIPDGKAGKSHLRIWHKCPQSDVQNLTRNPESHVQIWNKAISGFWTLT